MRTSPGAALPRQTSAAASALGALPPEVEGSGFPASPPRWADLAQTVRALGPQWLQAQEQAHAELLAVVWGPRFDREQARLLMERTGLPALHEEALEQAAQHFDALPPQRQQRLRRWLLRQHQRWDNARDTLH